MGIYEYDIEFSKCKNLFDCERSFCVVYNIEDLFAVCRELNADGYHIDNITR